MPQKKTLLIVCLFMILCNLTSLAQSQKAKKMYTHYESMDGAKIRTIPLFTIRMGASLLSKDPLINKVANKIESVKILYIPVNKANEIEDNIPGKKYNINNGSIKSVWVKRCLWSVKEAHLIIYKRRKTEVISVYGHVNIKDLKQINEKYIENGNLLNIPALLQHL